MTSAELAERLDDLEAMLEQIQATQHLILQAIRPAADLRHERLLHALAATMGDYDLEFSAPEVADRATQDHELAEAISACGVDPRDTVAIGTLFRSLRDQDIGGYRIIRSGRSWRLVRCTYRT